VVILPVHQGTPEWGSARAKYYRTASRAPVVMGASLYQSRNELLQELKTGIAREIDANTQALFDAGHAAEAEARKIVEGYLKAPLLPLTCLTDDNYLLASFDGINEGRRIGWECKLWNNELAARVRQKELDPHYYWQLEHQAIVGNLDYIIFTCSDGTPEKTVHLKYVPVSSRANALLAGWKQFDADLANYQHVEILPPVTATPVMQLPALSIIVNGSISLTDNLKVFGEKLTAFIERLPKAPATDEEFAQADQAIKILETAQEALEAAESSALAQVASVDEMRRTVALYAGQARSTRLMLTKLVAARKDSIRMEIVQGGRTELAKRISLHNELFGKAYMPTIAEDFAGAIRGKKTIASLRDAVATELARATIEATAIAGKIGLNLKTLRELGSDHKFLFADTPQLVLKEPDDLTNLVKLRISEHQQAEQKRLEAEREKIRQEEAAKLVQANAKAEADRLAEQQARITAEVDAAKIKDAQERAEKEAEDKRINAELAAEEAKLQQQRAERDKADGLKRAEEARQRELLDTDQLIVALYERIKSDKRYAGIAKACAAYIEKAQRKAA